MEIANGATVAQVCKKIGVTDQTYYQWRNEYGGMRVEQAKRLNELAKESAQLKKLVADQVLVFRNEGVGLLLCWRVAHSRFEDNHIHDNGAHGISVGHKDTDSLFIGNLIEGSVRHGVYLRDQPRYNAGHQCTFRANIIRSNGGTEEAAIWIDGHTADTRIINNEITDDRETPASCALHVGPNAGHVRWEGNVVTGFARTLSPESAPVDIGKARA